MESSFLMNFFSLPVLAFVLALAILIQILRKSLEYFYPNLKTAGWFQELVLPYSPILLGVIIAAIARTYPFPLVTLSGRMTCGLICGAFSDILYSKLHRLLAPEPTPAPPPTP